MFKRQRTLTPPPPDVPKGFDYGFGFGVGSSSGADDDYIDATGFGHIAKRRRVTIPLPSRAQNQNQSHGNGSQDDEDSVDFDDETDNRESTSSTPPSNLPHPSEYRTVNNLLHRLHLEHTKRNYLQSVSANGKLPSHMTDEWDTRLFDVAKFHAHNTVTAVNPTPQNHQALQLEGRGHDFGSDLSTSQRREPHEEVSSIVDQYQERNRLLGNAVRMRLHGQNDASRPS